MRNIIVLSMLILSSLSVGAFADEANTANTAADNAPQCQQVQLDGKTTTACFGLSDDQVQNLKVDENLSAQWPRCEVRCVVSDSWGRCIRWRRFCW
jgi:hypothetical protein